MIGRACGGCRRGHYMASGTGDIAALASATGLAGEADAHRLSANRHEFIERPVNARSTFVNVRGKRYGHALEALRAACPQAERRRPSRSPRVDG